MKPSAFMIEITILSNRQSQMDFIKHAHQLLHEQTFTINQQHLLLNTLRSRVAFSFYSKTSFDKSSLHQIEYDQVCDIVVITDKWNRTWFEQIHRGQKYFGNDDYLRSMSVIMS